MTEQEFTNLYDTYADAVYRYAYFRLPRKEEAQDLVQETFTRLWKCVTDGQTIDHGKTFLFTIAHNLLVDTYRKKKSLSLEALVDDGFAPSDGSDKTIETEAEVGEALKHIEALDEKYRDVLVLRFVEDLGPKDIAHIIGESENNVSVRINRGLAQLRELMTSPKGHTA